jgi:hypothetical protein
MKCGMRIAEWWWRGIPEATTLRVRGCCSQFIPRFAFRNPHFPHLSFVISTAIGYWQSASLHSFSKNEYRYFAQNHRIESPRID